MNLAYTLRVLCAAVLVSTSLSAAAATDYFGTVPTAISFHTGKEFDERPKRGGVLRRRIPTSSTNTILKGIAGDT